jgi:hypothetical protein
MWASHGGKIHCLLDVILVLHNSVEQSNFELLKFCQSLVRMYVGYRRAE